MLKDRHLGSWVVLVGIGSILLGCGQAVQSGSVATPTAVPAELSMPVVQPSNSSRVAQKPSPTPDPYQLLPPAKATHIAQEKQELDAARTAVAIATPPPPPLLPVETPRPVLKHLGLIAPTSPGVHVCECTLDNLWLEIVNGEYVAVWAGGYERPADQGLLMVETTTLDDMKVTSTQNFYKTPAQAGPVQIIAADGLRFTVQAKNGQQFLFDLATRSWATPSTRVSSKPAVLAYNPEEPWPPATATAVAQVAATPANLTTGILANSDPIWDSSEYRFENAWRSLGKTGYITVYAGAYQHNPNQGVLFVMGRTPDYQQLTELDFYETPIKAGAVHIIAADQNRLEIVAANGQQFSFDLNKRTWIKP